MQILDIPQPAVSNGIADSIISTVKPSAAAKSAIGKAQAEVDRLTAINEGCRASKSMDSYNNTLTVLHQAVDQAETAFNAEPTPENAERLHAAIVRENTAELSGKRIGRVIHQHLSQAAKLAEPAALEVIDAALAELDKQHASAKANVSKSSGIFQDVGEIDRRHEAAKGDLIGERNATLTGNPLSWLASKGIV